jgi:hypothetical protein
MLSDTFYKVAAFIVLIGFACYSLVAIVIGFSDVKFVSGLHGQAQVLLVVWMVPLAYGVYRSRGWIASLFERRQEAYGMEKIKEVHLYIEGGGDDRLVNEIVQALHPEFLQTPGFKIYKHDVMDWPTEPFVMAAVDLRLNPGIRLTENNCLTQDGFAYGKRTYLIMIK